MKKIAVLTTFMDFPRAYGLVPLVMNQLRMLVNHGYSPTLICQEMFNPQHKRLVPQGVTAKYIVPFLHLFDYQAGTKKQEHDVPAKGELTDNTFKPKTNFEKQVKVIEEVLEAELVNYDIVITHDIIFQTWFVPHNQAIRNIAQRHPEIRWLHWIHSGPSRRPDKLEYPHTLRFSGMKNSLWVVPNKCHVPYFASMFNIPQNQISIVNHVIDVKRFLDLDPLSCELIDKYDLLNSDVLAVFPTRFDGGKQPEKAIYIIAQMYKIHGKNAKIMFLNSWSNDEETKKYIKKLKDLATNLGLPKSNIIFTSEHSKELELGVSPRIVRDMFLIANVLILPSLTETFSFVAAEAAMTKNLLVLNVDDDVMFELYGQHALYGFFSSRYATRIVTREYKPNMEAHFAHEAEGIVTEIENNRALMQQRNVFKNYTENAVWKQMESLLQ